MDEKCCKRLEKNGKLNICCSLTTEQSADNHVISSEAPEQLLNEPCVGKVISATKECICIAVNWRPTLVVVFVTDYF